MKEQLITFETAKLAKEKGFDLKTLKFFYLNDSRKWYNDGDIGEGFNDDYWGNNLFNNWNKERLSFKPFCESVSAPTQSLLQKWLREIHNIDVCVLPYNTDKKYYEVIFGDKTITFSGYKTYEEALEVGLQEALKQIKL